MDKTFIQKYRLFGANVAYFRKLRGMTQEDLAERSGIDRSTVSKIEIAYTGITLDIVFKIAQTLDVDTAKLFESHI